jgi:hypothetical protein
MRKNLLILFLISLLYACSDSDGSKGFYDTNRSGRDIEEITKVDEIEDIAVYDSEEMMDYITDSEENVRDIEEMGDYLTDVSDLVEPDSLSDTGFKDVESVEDTISTDNWVEEIDNAAVVSIELPSVVECGQVFNGFITMKNTGNTIWGRDFYKLGAVGDSDPFIKGEPRVWMAEGSEVRPQESYKFPMSLIAPDSPGVYKTEWQMVHEFVHWFGEIASYEINVRCEVPIDASTLNNKLLMGYQGWFSCPSDGSPIGEWVHWFKSQTPDANNIRVDLFPDMSEYESDELCPTMMRYADGSTVYLYSAWNKKSVMRHFKWMKDYGIDGVLLQRFASELRDPRFFAARNRVLDSVREASELYGRVFAIEYDISGMNESTLVEDIVNDWNFLCNDMKIIESNRYLRHNGKPVLFIWGLGFNDRPGSVDQAKSIIDWFKKNAPQNQLVTLVGGVPTYWRTLQAGTDTKTEPGWADVYRSFDVINPWMVGRFKNEQEADSFKNNIMVPDIQECKKYNIEYMPVVFPGFSWHNMNRGTPNESPLNLIPRNGGRFYWRQVYNAISAGSKMIFNAMFDEVDEGTAMMKVVSKRADLPVGADFVYLEIDGYSLPSDFYLELAGKATKMLQGEIPLTPNIP